MKKNFITLAVLPILFLLTACSPSLSPSVSEVCDKINDLNSRIEKTENLNELKTITDATASELKAFKNDTTPLTDKDKEALNKAFQKNVDVLAKRMLESLKDEPAEVKEKQEKNLEQQKESFTKAIDQASEKAKTLGEYLDSF